MQKSQIFFFSFQRTQFEKQLTHCVDAVCVVSTGDVDVQRTRVLARPGMTPAKFDAILAKQMPDKQKRQRANFVVDTSLDLEATRATVQELVQELTSRNEPAGHAKHTVLPALGM